jgi:hypothetical protein
MAIARQQHGKQPLLQRVHMQCGVSYTPMPKLYNRYLCYRCIGHDFVMRSECHRSGVVWEVLVDVIFLTYISLRIPGSEIGKILWILSSNDGCRYKVTLLALSSVE